MGNEWIKEFVSIDQFVLLSNDFCPSIYETHTFEDDKHNRSTSITSDYPFHLLFMIENACFWRWRPHFCSLHHGVYKKDAIEQNYNKWQKFESDGKIVINSSVIHIRMANSLLNTHTWAVEYYRNVDSKSVEQNQKNRKESGKKTHSIALELKWERKKRWGKKELHELHVMAIMVHIKTTHSVWMCVICKEWMRWKFLIFISNLNHKSEMIYE